MSLHRFAFLLLAGCQQGSPFDVEPRAPGARAPLTSTCDEQDELRCLLPWPSSQLTQVDSTTTTGLRLAVQEDALLVDDDASFLNIADGFSRISGIATAFQVPVDPDSLQQEDAIWLFIAEPEHARYGENIPLDRELTQEGDDSLIIGRPRFPMPANAEHVVVVTTALTADDGGPLTRNRQTDLILDLVAPETRPEADLLAYHAPTRELLDSVGIDPQEVLRVWDFTTRSEDDPTKRLLAMQQVVADAVSDGEISAYVEEVEFPGGDIAAIVLGRLEGAPGFRDEEGNLVLDDDGLPIQQTSQQTPFRVVIPVGDDDYRTALYGHGTGGELEDTEFDEDMAAWGLAKANVRWLGWTGDEFLGTVGGLSSFIAGSTTSTAGLLQSLADVHLVLLALQGPLGDALEADTLLGEPSPVAGRRPDLSTPVWLGGSQGGTMGAVVTAANESIHYAVLNVPGAGWTHFIPHSYTDEAFLGALLAANYNGEIDVALSMLTAQGAWDDVDGSSWVQLALADGDMFLLQESMDDPVLPNIGTEILAACLQALQIEPWLEPLEAFESTAEPVTAGAALEQFRVPATGVYDVHGFAGRDTLAGDAAREQISAFLTSIWAGAPVMEHPQGCVDATSDGSCDFSDMW